jgi:Retroviral aspartyl protease
VPDDGEETIRSENPTDPNEDQEVEHDNADQNYDGELMGSQYTSQDEEYPDEYDDFEGYEEPQSDGDETEVQHFGLRVEEEPVPVAGQNVLLGTMDPDMDQDTVMRSSMKRVVGHMDRPTRKPEEIQCLTAYVNINGVEAYTLFDSGSTTDALSPDFTRVANLPLYVLETPMTLKLGCVGSKSKINYGTKAKTTFAHNTTVTYYDVANIDKYDAILGLPYMNANGIVLDIPAQRIRRGTIAIPPVPRGEERVDPRRQRGLRFPRSKSQ